MAGREYGRMWCSIWIDDDWLALDANAQWLYGALISQPGISPCGVRPLQPNKWAKLAKNQTTRSTQKAVLDLERANFIVVDRATDEILIRTHVRWDRGVRVPNVAKAVARRWHEIASAPIKTAVLGELRRMRQDPDFAAMAGWKEPEMKALLALTEVTAT